jgi:hypothetical protein
LVRGPVGGAMITVNGWPRSSTATACWRLLIVRLDDKLHVELFQRVIRYYGANATRIMTVPRLASAHGNQNRHDAETKAR